MAAPKPSPGNNLGTMAHQVLFVNEVKEDYESFSGGRIMIPEMMLWKKVLEQAYHDALGRGRDASLAQSWLRGDTQEQRFDLVLVCDFADVPLDRMISWAQRKWAGK